ncbi:MAG: type VI secretion system baseplate subunit TssF [Desulfobacterales bacterium]|nr:type VI secretion system baseplate subunit TssF [Desulfobacterales bacterium]
MFTRFFQQELANLKELGAEFSSAHPAVAPMLSGASADPDVERLLEGAAFLTALLRQKLDDDFPEIVHEMTRLIWPHYLRPLPGSTIIQFKPRPTLKQSLAIPAGIHIASVPVEGETCLFQTCYDVQVHPLHLAAAERVESPGKAPVIKLLLETRGVKLDEFQPGALRFHLGGDFPGAADLHLLLSRHLKRVVIRSAEGGGSAVLPPESLKPVGFSNAEGLIPYPSQSFPGYRIIQEYFLLPEKFLFFDLTGWDQWRDRGEGERFEIHFELMNLPFPPPPIKAENFILAASPAINLFPRDADPIRLDHRRAEYRVRPAGGNPEHFQVYSVEKVVGLVHGSAREKIYQPFDFFTPDDRSAPVYNVKMKKAAVRPGYDVNLSVAYSEDAGPPAPETLSIQLLCTNGFLPEEIQVGDVRLPTATSPELVEFANIRPPTINVAPPLGKNLLWRLLSHLSLNYASLENAENLRALLGIYIFEDSRDRAAVLANQKRIEGVENIESKASDRLVSGVLMRGREIVVGARHDHFASPGDLFLFGSVLDYFLGAYASINTYTRLSIRETLKGDHYRWPARTGVHPLL